MHDFQIIKCHRHGRNLYFTGAFHHRKYRFLCKLLRIRQVVPVFSRDQRDAEFHLSPRETADSLNNLRANYHEYQWFQDTVTLPDRTNEAMLPNFCVIVKPKDKDRWRYYVSGATGTSALKVSPNLYFAHRFNIDTIEDVCTAIHTNHKDYFFRAIPCPPHNLRADYLDTYLEENPPRPLFLTFRLK